jgi:hypothetical protein
MRTETDPVSEMLYSLEYRMKDKVKKPINLEEDGDNYRMCEILCILTSVIVWVPVFRNVTPHTLANAYPSSSTRLHDVTSHKTAIFNIKI